MNQDDKYVKIVEWSDQDNCFIGSCPKVFYGGCHGHDAKQVLAELCNFVQETIKLYKEDGKPLPSPLSGRDLVNAMQRSALRLSVLPGRARQ